MGLIYYISMSLKLSCKGLYKNLVNKVIAAENTWLSFSDMLLADILPWLRSESIRNVC